MFGAQKGSSLFRIQFQFVQFLIYVVIFSFKKFALLIFTLKRLDHFELRLNPKNWQNLQFMVCDTKIILSVAKRFDGRWYICRGLCPMFMGLHSKYSKFNIWNNCRMCEGVQLIFVFTPIGVPFDFCELQWATVRPCELFWATVRPLQFRSQWAPNIFPEPFVLLFLSFNEPCWVLASSFESQWAFFALKKFNLVNSFEP